MYDIAMSSNTSGSVHPNLEGSYVGPVADVDYLTDVSSLDFDESRRGGLGAFLMKGGAFCLIATVIFTGYQLAPQGKVKKNSFQTQSLHEWEKKSDKVVENSDLAVSVKRRFVATKTLDMNATASTEISNIIKKNQERVVQSEANTSKADKKTAKNKLYIVQAGDTLSKIAKMFKTSSNKLIAMNEIDNPSLIRPGMRLVVTK